MSRCFSIITRCRTWVGAGVLALSSGGATAGSLPSIVTVAQDGTGNFATVQQGVNAAPDGGLRLFVIQLKPGCYREKLVIPKTKGPLQLRGTDAAATVLTFDDNATTPDAAGKPMGTVRSASTAVLAEDFSAENVTFENTYGQGNQAVALNVFSNRAVFRHCRFLGWQDTLLVKGGAQYFEDCRIEGSVDFIFGTAAAFFEKCELYCRARGAITAASTPEKQAHGLVFSHCRITAAPGPWKTHLGRPWQPFASVTFLSTEMPDSIAPEGWCDWNDTLDREKTARYAEYRSTGPGANAAARVAWSRQLSDAEARELTPTRVLGWNPEGRVSAERSAGHLPNDKTVFAAELQKAGPEQPLTTVTTSFPGPGNCWKRST